MNGLRTYYLIKHTKQYKTIFDFKDNKNLNKIYKFLIK